MNVLDILKYGDQTLLGSIEDLAEPDWEVGGVCGVWSVKDIMAHMASYEHLLSEVLCTFLGEEFGPYMSEMAQFGREWNDVQVERRKDKSVAQILAEYEEAHQRVMDLATQIPTEAYRANGTMPWYGAEYCLDDFIVYANYAHKREHSAQIMVYRDQL
jgi:uncharacterized damage-inducible protein DinB